MRDRGRMRFTCLLPLFAIACTSTPAKEGAPVKANGPYSKVSRADFNRIAAELALPLFWRSDEDGVLAKDEVATLWGVDALASSFEEAYERVAKIAADGHMDDASDDVDKKRRALVIQELAQGRAAVDTRARGRFQRAAPGRPLLF